MMDSTDTGIFFSKEYRLPYFPRKSLMIPMFIWYGMNLLDLMSSFFLLEQRCALTFHVA